MASGASVSDSTSSAPTTAGGAGTGMPAATAVESAGSSVSAAGLFFRLPQYFSRPESLPQCA